eukprot:768728-Hanusia_phi.AAC.8
MSLSFTSCVWSGCFDISATSPAQTRQPERAEDKVSHCTDKKRSYHQQPEPNPRSRAREERAGGATQVFTPVTCYSLIKKWPGWSKKE